MGVNEVADRSNIPTLNMEQLLPDTKAKVTTNVVDATEPAKKKDSTEEGDYDFYRFMVADFHGIARSKLVTKSAYNYMLEKGPGVAWKTLLLSFDNYFNCEAKRVDGVRCTDARLTPAKDVTAVPRPLPWAGKGSKVAGIMCETWWGIDNKRQEACPRYMARRLCQQLEVEHGLRIFHASEMEFVLFDKEGKPLFDEGCLYIPQELSFLEEELLPLSKMCEEAGIPIETLQTEFGPGQIEIVLKPTFGIEGADNEFLFKNAVKEILQKPDQRGRATFMSKPIIDKVGSSNHYNHSLWKVKEDGGVEDAMWDADTECSLSKTAQYWLAGLLKHAPALAGETSFELFFQLTL
jgi:Glutamine synthetase